MILYLLTLIKNRYVNLYTFESFILDYLYYYYYYIYTFTRYFLDFHHKHMMDT